MRLVFLMVVIFSYSCIGSKKHIDTTDRTFKERSDELINQLDSLELKLSELHTKDSALYSQLFGESDFSNSILNTCNYSKIEVPIFTVPDYPLGFGKNNRWIAIKTNKNQEVGKILELNDLQPCNWYSGIHRAYQGGIFITPEIDEWILVVGLNIPNVNNSESIDQVKKMLANLSNQFGEAHYYCTNSKLEQYAWIKYIKGDMHRLYLYKEYPDRQIINEGNQTEIENKYNLIMTLSDFEKTKKYNDKFKLIQPYTDLVFEIAGAWSIDPSRIDNRKDISGLGLIKK